MTAKKKSKKSANVHISMGAVPMNIVKELERRADSMYLSLNKYILLVFDQHLDYLHDRVLKTREKKAKTFSAKA